MNEETQFQIAHSIYNMQDLAELLELSNEEMARHDKKIRITPYILQVIRVRSVSPKNAKTGLGAKRNQIRKKWRKRDRSLFARFMHSKAMPMTQKEVSCKCAMMRLSP